MYTVGQPVCVEPVMRQPVCPCPYFLAPEACSISLLMLSTVDVAMPSYGSALIGYNRPGCCLHGRHCAVVYSNFMCIVQVLQYI